MARRAHLSPDAQRHWSFRTTAQHRLIMLRQWKSGGHTDRVLADDKRRVKRERLQKPGQGDTVKSSLIQDILLLLTGNWGLIYRSLFTA